MKSESEVLSKAIAESDPVVLWTRRMRKFARTWAANYRPSADVTSYEEVREEFYTWLHQTHGVEVRRYVKDLAFTKLFTWHFLKKDIGPVLERKGFLIFPNRLLSERVPPYGAQFVVMRDPTPDDDPIYIEMVRDQILHAKLPRVRQMRDNADIRIGDLEEKIRQLTSWIGSNAHA